MKNDLSASLEPSTTVRSDVEAADDGRGRLLTRIPGTVRCPGRPRTLRHTGPSIHIWLQKQRANPDGSFPRDSGVDLVNNAQELKFNQHETDIGRSPFTRSSLSSGYRAPLEVLKQKQLSDIGGNDEHLSANDDGVTVTRILESQRGSPDNLMQRHNYARGGNQASGVRVMSGAYSPRRPSPVSAGMQYAALWEWVCSDAVPTEIQSTHLAMPNLPGRFVEYENFAARYLMVSSKSGEQSNAACGTRTDE